MIAANMPLGAKVAILLSVMVVTTIFLASKPTLSMPYDQPTSITNSSFYPSNGTFTGSNPGCQSKCGNLAVPYPFGIGDNCSMHPWFTIRCNTSFNPARAFFYDFEHTMEALAISETEIRVTNQVATVCYNSQWSRTRNSTASTFQLQTNFFTFSTMANIFTVVGCNHYAAFTPFSYHLEGINASSRNYNTGGCLSRCFSEDSMRASCSGIGCCQTPIPEDYLHHLQRRYTSMGIELQLQEGLQVFNGCNYAFLGEKDRFNLRGTEDLKDPHLLERIIATVPIVLEWTVGDGKCSQAQSNQSTYLCQANTECVDVDNSYGYRSSCLPGYEGNPYLEPGCTDINECMMPDNYPCFGCASTRSAATTALARKDGSTMAMAA